VGNSPVRAVHTLDAIIREAERAALDGGGFDVLHRVDASRLGPAAHAVALCEAAVALAARARAAAIVAMTEAGKTARVLAALRPAARIIAGTPNARTAGRLALVWGVTPVVVGTPTVAAMRDAIVARGLVPGGSVVVFVAMHPVLGRENTNFLHVERL
jgi:pyruvate kinase